MKGVVSLVQDLVPVTGVEVQVLSSSPAAFGEPGLR